MSASIENSTRPCVRKKANIEKIHLVVLFYTNNTTAAYTMQ